MLNENLTKEMKKETKKYTSISTRLPKADANDFLIYCERLGTNASERLRLLIIHDLKKPQRYALAGINKIKYDKTGNSFSWLVQLDSGQEIEVLNNIPIEFLKNFQSEIQEAIKERNEWVHQTKPNSVDIPGGLIKDE